MRWVEVFSALLNIGYVLGLIWHKRWAWPAGGLGCILAVWLFFDQHLYLEALLNVAYIGMAVDVHTYPMPHTISPACFTDLLQWFRQVSA